MMRIKDAVTSWPPDNPAGSYSGADRLDINPVSGILQKVGVVEDHIALVVADQGRSVTMVVTPINPQMKLNILKALSWAVGKTLENAGDVLIPRNLSGVYNEHEALVEAAASELGLLNISVSSPANKSTTILRFDDDRGEPVSVEVIWEVFSRSGPPTIEMVKPEIVWLIAERS